MSAYENSNEDAEDYDAQSLPGHSATLDGKPLEDADHGEILRMIISEGTEAAMETFFEAKDPDMDPLLKLKMRGMASNLGDNVRKAIATCATHFGCKS